jgi:hypothetical protein
LPTRFYVFLTVLKLAAVVVSETIIAAAAEDDKDKDDNPPATAEVSKTVISTTHK